MTSKKERFYTSSCNWSKERERKRTFENMFYILDRFWSETSIFHLIYLLNSIFTTPLPFYINAFIFNIYHNILIINYLCVNTQIKHTKTKKSLTRHKPKTWRRRRLRRISSDKNNNKNKIWKFFKIKKKQTNWKSINERNYFGKTRSLFFVYFSTDEIRQNFNNNNNNNKNLICLMQLTLNVITRK